jgi:hypothetical protein
VRPFEKKELTTKRKKSTFADMNGIYLTEQGKQEIELELTKLESEWNKTQQMWGKIFTLRQILSSATILPVEESWGSVPISTNECELLLPNGVIIQSKQ